MIYFSDFEILESWKNTKNKTGVYIHSPFCKEQCEYCTFKGTLFNKEAYKRYYSDYLPKLLEFYNPVLSSDIIHCYFFGGGTPSLMSPETMRDIFDCIPNFKEIPRKVMEFHMCDWTREQLDVLKEYNFNTVIACVQTFDNEMLRKEGRRRPKSPEVIYEFIEYANSIGLHTMSDIIFFGNLNRLASDMQTLADHNITEISVQTIFDEKGAFDVAVTQVINEFLENNLEYIKCPRNRDNPFNDFCDEYGNKTFKESKIYKKNVDWYEMYSGDLGFLDGLYTGQGSVYSTDYNTLGIGSYNNWKYTFSKIEDKLEYIEAGDTYTPTWYLTYNKKDYPTKKLIAEFYKNLEDSIGEPPDGITFSFKTAVKQHKEDTVNKTVARELEPSVSWEEDSIIVLDYVSKLKTLYPDWNWQ